MTDSPALISFLIFCLVLTGTPGPNNMMVLVSAARAGVVGAMPLIAGIAGGSALLLAGIGLGLGNLVSAIPWLQTAMKVAGAGLLLWIAAQIAFSGPIGREDDDRAPVGIWRGAAFQWVNPKAWAVTTGAVFTYLPVEPTIADIGLAACVLAGASVSTLLIWASGGAVLRRFLRRPVFATVFNGVAASLLAASIVPLWVPMR
ncbi:MAG: LysE family translocator [Pseudomonadota bacterium]